MIRNYMKHLIAPAIFAVLGLTEPLWAQDTPVVVELYTSQGCSACPPADELMLELAERPDVIALALHVDYWDYIGWEDPFGDPAFSDRQRAYAAAGQRRSVYTPEMIVMGQTDIVGARPMALGEAIAEHAKIAPEVKIDLKREDDTLHVSVAPLEPLKGPFTIHLLRYAPLQTTEITRGENRGKTVKSVNVVEDWHVIGTWDGAAPITLDTSVTGAKPVVVIVQKHQVGPIMAAARLQ